ncbi:MAG TPA: NIPSNAP family protein [Candidatus Competibacteraceae bacterium]|nr:NIPSNAP family protein [Candidatus Competibacteraceae bacterium]
MPTQIRIFTVRSGQMENLVQAWRTQVYPLRRAHGYQIDGAWIAPETNQFIWLLRYDGHLDWTTKEAVYYACPERVAMSPDPMDYVEEVEQFFVEPLPLPD